MLTALAIFEGVFASNSFSFLSLQFFRSAAQLLISYSSSSMDGMEHSEVLCLRLITDLAQSLDHHCTLCSFFHEELDNCTHGGNTAKDIQRNTTPFSEVSGCTFYTARTSDSSSSMDSYSSTSTVKPSTAPSMPNPKRQSLRRTLSPTHYSLRDLHQQQAASNLRQKQSEEALQRVYESQIMEYLNSSSDLGMIEE